MSVGHSRRTSRKPSPQNAGRGGQRLLEVGLDAVLLERRGLAHVVLDVREHLGDADVEPVLAGARALAHDDPIGLLLDHRRRRHPVARLEAAVVGVDHHRPVALDHDQPQRLGQDGGEAARVPDLAAGDDEAHDGLRSLRPSADIKKAPTSVRGPHALCRPLARPTFSVFAKLARWRYNAVRTPAVRRLTSPRARAQPEARLGLLGAPQPRLEALGERRAVLEAVARAPAQQPHAAVVVGVRGHDEVHVGRDLVLAGAMADERRLGQGREAMREIRAREALVLGDGDALERLGVARRARRRRARPSRPRPSRSPRP